MSNLTENLRDSGSTETRLIKIIRFWERKAENWEPPSQYIKSFRQLSALLDLQNLKDNAIVAMGQLFQNRVDYSFSVIKLYKDEPVTHVCLCRFPGFGDGVEGHGRDQKEAKDLAALNALRLVLGSDFVEYCDMSSPSNFVGVSTTDLRIKFESTLDWFLDRNKLLEESHSGGSSNSFRYFDEAILELDPLTWRKFPKMQRETIFQAFWVKTLEVTFPLTFNLCGQPQPTRRGSLEAFKLILPENLRSQVIWTTLSSSAPFRVKCQWKDDCGGDHEAQGIGSTLELAKGGAAREALRIILGNADFIVLGYASKLFSFDGNDRTSLNFQELKDSLQNKVKSAGEVVTASPVGMGVPAIAVSARDPRLNRAQALRYLRNTPSQAIRNGGSSSTVSMESNHNLVRQREDRRANLLCTRSEVDQTSVAPVNTSSGFFPESILSLDQQTWECLGAAKKEDILFEFWLNTSREKFPRTFNLFGLKHATTLACTVAFEQLFSSSGSLRQEGLTWQTLHKRPFTVRCTWDDEIGKSYTVEGSGRNVPAARNNASRKALRIILGTKDYEILQHVSQDFFYEGTHRPNLEGLKQRLEANIPPLRSQRTVRRSEVSEGGNFQRRSDLAYSASTPVYEPTILTTNSLFTATPNSDEHNDPRVGYFNESILKIDPNTWRTYQKKQKEDILFDFWVNTSRLKFPRTFNLCGERLATTKQCLGAFMLLFSEGKKIWKHGVDWKTLNDSKPWKVKCTWTDVEGVQHSAEGTGKHIDEARNEAAKRALRIILGDMDFAILEHVSAPFFYEGSQSERVDIEALKSRLRQTFVPVANQRTTKRPPSSVSLHAPSRGVRGLQGRNEASSRPQPRTGALTMPAAPRIADGRPWEVSQNIGPSIPEMAPLVPVAASSYRREILPTSASPRMTGTAIATSSNSQSEMDRSNVSALSPSDVNQSAAPVPLSSCRVSRGTFSAPAVPVPSQPLLSPADLFASSPKKRQKEVPCMDPFAEFFSTNEDGTLEIPALAYKEYFKPHAEGALETMENLEEDTDRNNAGRKFPPFDKILGYVLPVEAAEALEVLTEDRDYLRPSFESKKYVVVECEIGSQRFTGIGSNEEEAREDAAAKALVFFETHNL